MRRLQHQVAGARAAWRRALSRVPGRSAAQLKPARLVIRLCGSDLPDGSPAAGLAREEPMTLLDWRKVIVSAVEWMGPVPVTFLARHKGDHELLMELVRFAHRLECGTELVTDGTGIDEARALAFIDCGLARVRVFVGGDSDEVQGAIVGNTVTEATGAVMALLAARRDRGASLDIEVATPWEGAANEEVKAVMGWARQAGVDGFRVIAPYRAHDLPADPELLDELVADTEFCRTPTATADEIHSMVAHQDDLPGSPGRSADTGRVLHRCPVAGQRVEIHDGGAVYACPFKAPMGTFSGDLRDTWKEGQAHVDEIQRCDRSCAHVELAPRPVWG